MTTTRIAALAALATLSAAAPAAAAPVDLGGGSTTLKLDARTAKALTGAGFGVSAISPARAGKAGIAFPVTGGRVDDATARGSITHSGGLRFTLGRRTVRLTSFTVSVRRGLSTLSAKANGGPRAHVVELDVGNARIRRDGGDLVVSRITADLTQRGANALNKAFGVKAFARGVRLGQVTVRATPADLRFTDGATSLALDAGAAAALRQLGVTPGLVGPATANQDGSLAFPITPGSTVDAKTLAGTIGHTGGISLTKGSTVVQLTDFDVVIDDTPSLLARVNGSAEKVEILTLDVTSTAPPTATAELTKAAADALNAAFGTTAFTEGLVLGVATVRGEV